MPSDATEKKTAIYVHNYKPSCIQLLKKIVEYYKVILYYKASFMCVK